MTSIAMAIVFNTTLTSECNKKQLIGFEIVLIWLQLIKHETQDFKKY
jgi:hypothetical protein